MAAASGVRYVRIGGIMVAKPVSIKVSGAWHAIQTVPDAPTGVTAVPGDTAASLTWTAPAYTGGIPITSYTVTRSPGNVTSSASGTSATITGLTNGTAYTFTVKATNAVGAGAASTASNSVTPSATITGSMYLTPATGSYSNGATVTVTIRENSLATPINAIQADLTYSTAQLQYQSATINSAVFPVTLQNTGGSGTVTIAVGSLSTDPTGDQIVATVTFTAIATGSPALTVTASARIYRSSDSVDILNSKAGASYTIT